MKISIFIFLLILLVHPLFTMKAKAELHQDLIESIYKLDSEDVLRKLKTHSPFTHEKKTKLLRITDSIVAQESYKKNRMKKKSFIHMMIGGSIALLCVLYVYQDQLTKKY